MQIEFSVKATDRYRTADLLRFVAEAVERLEGLKTGDRFLIPLTPLSIDRIDPSDQTPIKVDFIELQVIDA